MAATAAATRVVRSIPTAAPEHLDWEQERRPRLAASFHFWRPGLGKGRIRRSDRFRRPRIDNAQLPEHGEGDIPARGDLAQQTQQRSDLARAMAQLSERERELVWLAYGQGSTHQEIAGALGLKTRSIKPLLFRARRKLARILRS